MDRFMRHEEILLTHHWAQWWVDTDWNLMARHNTMQALNYSGTCILEHIKLYCGMLANVCEKSQCRSKLFCKLMET